jgi:hypothetical protein
MGLIAARRSREQKRPEEPLQERDPECEQSLRREERYRTFIHAGGRKGKPSLELHPVVEGEPYIPPTCWQPFAGR